MVGVVVRGSLMTVIAFRLVAVNTKVLPDGPKGIRPDTEVGEEKLVKE